MKKSKAILLLLSLPFLVVTAGAVFLGTAFACWETGQFNIVLFLFTFVGACFLHISCNVANDYFDFKSGNDALNRNALVPFSGGSRMVLDGFVRPKEALAVSVLFAILGSAIGLYLNSILKGNIILFIGLAALFFVFSFVAYKVGMRNLDNWPGFFPAVKNTILMNFTFLVILSVSFVI